MSDRFNIGSIFGGGLGLSGGGITGGLIGSQLGGEVGESAGGAFGTDIADIPGGIGESLFGDVSGEEQAAAQAAENAARIAFMRQMAEQARGDIFNLFPAAEQARQQGTQAALDIFGQTIPQQMGVLQQGNVGAQTALTQGLPQIMAALQGTPIDLSQIQPQTLGFDPSFASQTLPQFQSTQSLFPEAAPQTGGAAPRFGSPEFAQSANENFRNLFNTLNLGG
jgi:hypothetical protein